MRQLFAAAVAVFLVAGNLSAQTDRGTFTGIVTDASGALIPGVDVRVTNANTGSRYATVTTGTGNYALAQVPAGQYELTVELPGFRTFIQRGIRLQVAQTVRIDVQLEVGAVTETVLVTADAPLLNTEDAAQTTNVESETLNELPILGVGQGLAGSQGIRNPLSATILTPGAQFVANSEITVNNTAENGQQIRVDGQDSTNYLIRFAAAETQPSVDAIQEVSIQTSTYAAEYGQSNGAIFNFTTRSGSNQVHGSVYNHYVNEFLNAGAPFQPLNASGNKPREGDRKNNFGGTIGGPVVIPGFYNGRNRTFFFFNFEQFRESKNVTNDLLTLPIPEYRNGDFSSLLTGRVLGKDPLGRDIVEGTIYDPATERVVNGQVVRDPFPGNIIPRDRMDPVALGVQSLIPDVTIPGRLTNNAVFPYESRRISTIPSIKVDHNWTENFKMSFYASSSETGSQFSNELGQADGLPPQLTAARGTFIEAHEERLNFDWTLSPTLLFHFGVGYQHNDFKDTSPAARANPSSDTSNGAFANFGEGFNAFETFGLPNVPANLILPVFTGLTGPQGTGGMNNIGPFAGQTNSFMEKPTGVANLSWVSGNHSYKFGSDYRLEGWPEFSLTNTAGSFTFSPEQTGLGTSQPLGGGFVGHNYASFLLGSVNTGNIAPIRPGRTGKQAWALFAQDTWKVLPTLTLDYGLRWDWSGYHKENQGRIANFDPSVINSQTGTPGGLIFEGDFTPGHCQCEFLDTYKNAWGPRLGASWQIRPGTVLRGGGGVMYGPSADQPGAGFVSGTPFDNPAVGQPALLLKDGPPDPAPFPEIDTGVRPSPGNLNFNGVFYSSQDNRPSRIIQFNLALQQEIGQNLMVEAGYVGNRGNWWQADGLVNINANSPERLAAFGFDVTDPADRLVLRSRVDSQLAIDRGFGPDSELFPFTEGENGATRSFPTDATVAQMLRPFPQFGNIGAFSSPLGKTWYDALQVRVIKRLSFGLDFQANYTWQKELAIGLNDTPVRNPLDFDSNKTVTGNSRPQVLTFAGNYTVPQLNQFHSVLNGLLSGWRIGAVLTYASGQPLAVPTVSTDFDDVTFLPAPRAVRTGEPLFQDVDSLNSDFDPLKTFPLNAAAWERPADGEFGGSVFQNDFRARRRPSESMSFGREFVVSEGKTLSIRAEFTNVFNRVIFQDPSTANFEQAQRAAADGTTTGGFGRIAPNLGSRDLPRQGTIVARLRF